MSRLRDWTLQYSMLWAAVQEDPNDDCICPEEWTSKGDECFRVITKPTEQPPTFTPLELIEKTYYRYGVYGTKIFDPGYDIDGSGTFTVYNTNSFWHNASEGSSRIDGPMNRCALWADSYYDFQEIGFAVCINVPAEKTFLIGFGVDNYVRIRVDGEPVFLMPVQEDALTFNFWNVYPVTLRKGIHILEILAYNETSIAAVGAEIYDCSVAELMAINNENDLDEILIFSTKNMVGGQTNLGTDGYPVQLGFALANCFGEPPFYRKIEYIPCETTPTEKTDGKYIALGGNSFLIVSKDFGETFTEVFTSSYVKEVTISASGQYMSIATNTYLYVSSDYGDNWTQKESSRDWRGISMSASGQYQTAVVNNGYFYVSSDYGATWSQKGTSYSWFSVAISGSGERQVAAGNNKISISTDYGATWTDVFWGNGYGRSIAMDFSGQYITIGAAGVRVSDDYGSTWALKSGSTDVVYGVAINNNGELQLATRQNIDLYRSADYGATWNTIIDSPLNWFDADVNYSGEIQIAVANDGMFFLSKSEGKGWERIMIDRPFYTCAINKYNEV